MNPSTKDVPLSLSQVGTFAREGFVIIEGLLDKIHVSALYKTTVDVVRVWWPTAPTDLADAAPFSSPAFHEALARFRGDAPALFGAMYDAVQVSAALQQAMCSRPLVEAAAQILGDEPEGLAATGTMLRMDAPRDTRNALDWHQEAAYYDQNECPANGVVCWIPLRDVKAEHGSVWFCRGSHRDGAAPREIRPKETYESSEQLRVPEHVVARYEHDQVLCKAGDAVFFHMDMIHKSGQNVSSEFRFSAGVRFHRMLTGDFLPGRFAYVPNATIQRMRAEAKTR